MITIIYAAILGFVYVGLTGFVVAGRYKYKTGLGDGGHAGLARRIRAHGNFAEYVPFALLLILMVDLAKFAPLTIHLLGAAQVAGRLLHAWGICVSAGATPMRMMGMILTLGVLLVSSALLLWHFIALRAVAF